MHSSVTTAVEYRCVPTAKPSMIDHNTNVVSRVSFSTFRKRTIAKTATIPNANAMLPATSDIIKPTKGGITTKDATNV